jgi:hypothetical protein
LAAKGLAVASQYTASHFIFHQENFWQKQHDYRPPSNLFSLFPRLKIKLKGRHFDTTEVMETDSQAVNTLTRHDFQNAFKKWQKLCER